MRYVFFINPAAGKGDSQAKIVEKVKKYFKKAQLEYKIHITTAPGDAKAEARKEAETGDKIRMFAGGGEGTVFEVLNGIAGFDNVELGVIPCGSANDFLKFFNTKKEFLDIAAQIEGETVKMDLIKADDMYCLNGCSVGMDAMVARDMSLFKNKPLVSGKFSYKLAVAKNFLSKLGVTADISVDGGEPENHRCLFAVIANAPYYGGGYMSAPNAIPFDQKLDFTLVDVISKVKVPKFLSLYEKGLHSALDYCHLKRCTSMEFWAKEPIPVNLDGEIVESTNMKFSIVEKALDFVVPKGVKIVLPTSALKD